MNIWLILLAVIFISPLVQDSYAQTVITVNSTSPCFLNATAGVHMLQNCMNDNGDIISVSLLWIQWVTGGYFSMILVSMFVLSVYIKYNKVIYAVAIGVVFIPIAFQFFPGAWWGFIIPVVALGVAVGIIYMIREQIR